MTRNRPRAPAVTSGLLLDRNTVDHRRVIGGDQRARRVVVGPTGRWRGSDVARRDAGSAVLLVVSYLDGRRPDATLEAAATLSAGAPRSRRSTSASLIGRTIDRLHPCAAMTDVDVVVNLTTDVSFPATQRRRRGRHRASAREPPLGRALAAIAALARAFTRVYVGIPQPGRCRRRPGPGRRRRCPWAACDRADPRPPT